MGSVRRGAALWLCQTIKKGRVFSYLLTSRLSQDERQSCGSNDHPTQSQFFIVVNCLSFYNLAKTILMTVKTWSHYFSCLIILTQKGTLLHLSKLKLEI